LVERRGITGYGNWIMSGDKEYLGFLGIALASVIWGSNGVIVNWINLPPATIAFFRVLLASIFLFFVAILTGRRNILKIQKVWPSLIFLGVLLGFGWLLLFQSMRLIPIAETVLLNYTGPVFVALLAPSLLREKFERRILIPLCVSLAGILFISLPQIRFDPSSQSFLGSLLGLAAGFLYALFIVLSKKTLRGVSSFATAFYSYAVAAILLTPSLISVNLSLDLSSWTLLLILGVLNTGVAVTVYFAGLKLLKAQEAVVLTYLEPVSAMFFGYLLLAQMPTLVMIVGGALIIAAGYFITHRRM
jgi:drug/metabolite transporter (DMT)-like permease